MCRNVRVLLSETERKAVARWSGVLVPIYASLVLAVVAAAITYHVRHSEVLVAAARAPDR